MYQNSIFWYKIVLGLTKASNQSESNNWQIPYLCFISKAANLEQLLNTKTVEWMHFLADDIEIKMLIFSNPSWYISSVTVKSPPPQHLNTLTLTHNSFLTSHLVLHSCQVSQLTIYIPSGGGGGGGWWGQTKQHYIILVSWPSRLPSCKSVILSLTASLNWNTILAFASIQC